MFPNDIPGQHTLLNDAFLKIGSYSAQASPFAGGAPPDGSGPYQRSAYSQWGRYNPGSFPNNTGFYWNLPGNNGQNHTPLVPGIWGYNAITYGDYFNTNPIVPIPAVQLGNCQQLTQTWLFQTGGVLNGWDVIADGFLTDAANSTNRLGEYEMFFHTPAGAADFILNHTTRLPDYVDEYGVVWSAGWDVAGTGWNDLLACPADLRDITAGTRDILRFLNYGQANGIFQPTWWLNGTSIGAEPSFGGGYVFFNEWSATLV